VDMGGPIHIETVTTLKNIKLCMDVQGGMKLENVLGRILTSRRLFLTCDLEGDENDEY
jgi:hypothetical protein